MKRLLTLFLTLALLTGIAIAESSSLRDFTVDEQAYDVYLDVSYVHNQSIRYLSEFGRLWDLANDLNSITDVDETWFHTGFIANFGNSDSETISRLATFQRLATDKYGYNSIPELYPAFDELLSEYAGKTTDIIWAGLSLGIEAHYIGSPDELKTYMDNAMQGIRNIMSMDREYPFLKDLQNYYKEASYLLDYITDFKDNYIGCQEMLATQKKNQSSYTIDFEFIFDPDDFDYVMEVGAAEAAEKEKAIYDRAVALENSGDYAGAIDLYWQCYYYKDSSEKMKECQREISYQQMEISYQQALAFETKGDLASAISIYRELGEYKDCPIRFESICKQMQNMKLVSIIEEQFKGSGSPFYTTETVYAYDENGVLQTIENKTDTLPYSEVVAVDENGKIISGVLTGQWSSDAQRIMIVEKEYNEYGDIVSEKTTYSSYDNWMHKDGEVAYSTYEYTYDEYGYATQMQEYYNGEEYTLYKYINTYDSDGLLTHMDEYRDGELKYRYDYDYNIAGMLITQTCYSESSSITTRSTYTYESIP